MRTKRGRVRLLRSQVLEAKSRQAGQPTVSYKPRSQGIRASVRIVYFYNRGIHNLSLPFIFCYICYTERFQSRVQHLCKFIGTKENVCIRKEFNSHRIV